MLVAEDEYFLAHELADAIMEQGREALGPVGSVMTLRTRRSSTRGLPWGRVKKGRSRDIGTSVNQKGLAIEHGASQARTTIRTRQMENGRPVRLPEVTTRRAPEPWPGALSALSLFHRRQFPWHRRLRDTAVLPPLPLEPTCEPFPSACHHTRVLHRCGGAKGSWRAAASEG